LGVDKLIVMVLFVVVWAPMSDTQMSARVR